jgi:hypothetical protein
MCFALSAPQKFLPALDRSTLSAYLSFRKTRGRFLLAAWVAGFLDLYFGTGTSDSTFRLRTSRPR